MADHHQSGLGDAQAVGQGVASLLVVEQGGDAAELDDAQHAGQ